MEKAQFAALPVRSAPKNIQGAHYGLGAYITDISSAGASSVLICPNLLGTTPLIDKCRNYAAILIVEKPEEEKKILSPGMKNLADAAIGGGCP
jgi:hypothetical protein